MVSLGVKGQDLQEGPEGQHHQEPHFFLEDPKNMEKTQNSQTG